MPRKRRWVKSCQVLVVTLLAGFSALVSFANPAATIRETSATRDRGRMEVGILGGIGLFNSYYGNGVSCGVTFSYGFSKNIAIELAGLFISGNGENDPNTLPEGKLTIMPLQLSLLGRFPLGRKLTPYVLAGASYYLNSFSLDSMVANNWNMLGLTLTENVKNAFGFHFGTGLEYKLSPALSVALDLRYFLGKAKGDWSIRDNTSAVETAGTFSGLNLNTMVCFLGLKYFFK
jgi:outer membrane protein W